MPKYNEMIKNIQNNKITYSTQINNLNYKHIKPKKM